MERSPKSIGRAYGMGLWVACAAISKKEVALSIRGFGLICVRESIASERVKEKKMAVALDENLSVQKLAPIVLFVVEQHAVISPSFCAHTKIPKEPNNKNEDDILRIAQNNLIGIKILHQPKGIIRRPMGP